MNEDAQPQPRDVNVDRRRHVVISEGRSLDRESSTPLYLQLQRLLDAAIDGYPHGARLPSEHEIASRFSVSRHVARQALDRLVTEARAIRRHGSGYFVNRHRFTRSLPTLRSFTESMLALGVMVEHEVIVGETVPAVGPLLRLCPDGDDTVFRLVRLAVADDEVLARLEGFYPRTVGERLDLERIATEGVYRQLSEFGVLPSRSESVLRVVFADVEVADQMSIPSGGALYEVKSWTTDAADVAVEFSRELDRGDRFEFAFTARTVSSFELSPM